MIMAAYPLDREDEISPHASKTVIGLYTNNRNIGEHWGHAVLGRLQF
ncbi:MAG: hypothetical protein ACI87E_003427 [Mariniblastus sp.]|jgi:hypothetical protein